MSDRAITITRSDMERLRQMLEDERERLRRSNGHSDEHLKRLEAELNRARIIEPHEASDDLITMHTEVQLADLDTGEELNYTLVFPDEADVRRQRISVLAPIGTAMLGYRVGDVFEWPVPDGMRHLKVIGVRPVSVEEEERAAQPG